MTLPQYVVVVGVDYSAASERALDEALNLACSKHRVQLHIANVRSDPGAEAASAEEAAQPPPWRYWASELQEFVARKVAAFQVAAGAAPFQHLYTHQRMGDPAHELAQLAADVEADLVVVGTHDWHRASQRLLGSVTEAVTRLAPCPVLVVRRKAVSPPSPAIQPACPACIAARQGSNGADLWCEHHSRADGHRHTYQQSVRVV
jgi:nucleotide-binding universal stress UspA family protein